VEEAILDAVTLGRLRRWTWQHRRRVDGRYAGGHKARGHGASLDFADYREYVPGDDPRRVDVHAHARLGRRLVKLYEAEDESALRVVLDTSASMRFGRKARAAQQCAATVACVAAIGGDRARVVLAGVQIDAGPWFRGVNAVPWLQQRLVLAQWEGEADLVGAVNRAAREGPTGPVVLVSDLLDEQWPQAVRALAANRGDALLIHLLGRGDLQPDLDGDVRVVDAERGEELEVGIAASTLDDYAAVRDRWLHDVAAECRRGSVARISVVDDDELPDVLLERLVAAGALA